MSEKAKITYFSTKEPITCPICAANVPKEEILSGSGRLIAADLTDELHRPYEKTSKFGAIYPLAYSTLVCPSCYFAALASDFKGQMLNETVRKLKNSGRNNLNNIKSYFSPLSFGEPRTLNEGIASYLLAIQCYELMDKNFAPTFKQGLCSLRAAWLCDYLHHDVPHENYNYMALILKRKASFYYRKAMELEEQGTEPFTMQNFLGPDQDKNYGFEGVLYLSGLLEFKYGNKDNIELRIKTLEASRSAISRIVGMGKASKDKPTAILEQARNLYNQIKEELSELEKEQADA